MATAPQIEIRRDAQVRQLRNGFIVTVQNRVVDPSTQKVTNTETEELIAKDAMEAANYIGLFLTQDIRAQQEAEAAAGQDGTVDPEATEPA